MTPSTTELDLNLRLPNRYVVAHAVQNDRLSRKIKANLFDGGVAWTPPAGADGIVRFCKPDGTTGFYDEDEAGNTAVTWDGNVATIMLAEQVLTVAGDVYCQINFYTGSEEKLTTFAFIIAVEKSVITDETIESTDYFNILSAQISAILAALAEVPTPSSSNPLMDGTAAPGSSVEYARGDHVHPTDTSRASTAVATTSANGLLSSTDKTKLNGIASGAEVNQNAFSNVKVGSTTIAADSKTDTLELVAGSNVTLTPDATNDKITIAATDTTYNNATQSVAGLMSASDKTKLDGIASGAQVNSITGVKGNSESSYRTGNVNLTAGNIGAAPTSHADSSTTYGKGTDTNYGHVKLTDSLTDTTTAASGGLALSAKGGKDLKDAINGKAPIASPTFTGTPTAPTAPTGTNTTQIATTAFTVAEVQARIYFKMVANAGTVTFPVSSGHCYAIFAMRVVTMGQAYGFWLIDSWGGIVTVSGVQAITISYSNNVATITNGSGGYVNIAFLDFPEP